MKKKSIQNIFRYSNDIGSEFPVARYYANKLPIYALILGVVILAFNYLAIYGFSYPNSDREDSKINVSVKCNSNQVHVNQPVKHKNSYYKSQIGAYKVEFKGVNYSVYSILQDNNSLQLFLYDDSKNPFISFKNLKEFLNNKKNEDLVFAINAGIFNIDRTPTGLYIENKNTIFPLNKNTDSQGNFYMSPNGVFAFRKDKSVVVPTFEFYDQDEQYDFATQSGPMLVYNKDINSIFNKDSNNKYTRSGVGIDEDGFVIIAISESPINFYDFALFFKEKVNCVNALYLDGGITKMYSPEINKNNLDANLGPILAITKKIKKP